MSTITEVRLEGFQSHVESHFQLGPGLNVVTGPSDAGKTSIIRAIRWVAFNEPQGEAFVNATVGEAVVTLFLDSGVVITKRRRKGKTSYLLQLSPDDEGSLYEKSEVPDEVKNMLQIDKQRFGDFESSLNFAFQLDAPFLISETASAGAKILGKLAGTECVDLAIKGISKDTHAARQERSSAEKDAERISASMLAFLGLDDQKNAVETAELVIENVEKSVQRLEDLKSYRRKYEDATEKLATMNERLKLLENVPQLAIMVESIEKEVLRFERISQTNGELLRLQDRIEGINRTLLHYQSVEDASILVILTHGNLDKLAQLQQLKDRHAVQTSAVDQANIVLEKTANTSEALQIVTAIEVDIQKFVQLRLLASEHIVNAGRVEVATERLQRNAEAADKGSGTIKRIDVNFERLETFRELAEQFEIRRRYAEEKATSVLDAQEAIIDAKYAEQEAWEEAGGICPLCGQPHEGGSHA